MYKAVFIIAASVAASGAVAQTNTDANANSLSASQSASIAGGGNVSITNNSGGASTVRYQGGYEVRNVPGLAGIGAITANPCALSVGATGSGVGFGLGVSTAYLDEDCNLRAEAAALQAVSGNKAAVAHLARDPEMCQTLRGQGLIAAQSLCTNEERQAAEKAAKQAASSKSAKAVTLNVECRRTAQGTIQPVAKRSVVDAFGMDAVMDACRKWPLSKWKQ